VSQIAQAAYLCAQNPSASFRSIGQALGWYHSTISYALQENLPWVQVYEKVDGESLNGYRRVVKTIEEGADFGEEFASNEANV
jgi:hypothetical protein